MTNPFEILKRKEQILVWIKLGEIKPTGWLYQQMHNGLVHGYVGHLDRIVPDLILDDDIYGADRLTRQVKVKDVGTVAQSIQDIQYLWWSSETQSNWWDGFVRTALLVEHTPSIEKAHKYVERMLSYQDDDYFGIYAPDLRFNFDGENGELWAQSTLFRALLGYYEATGTQEVLHAIEKAVQLTMAAYPIGKSEPFDPMGTSGVPHGLTFTDTLDRLFQLTENEIYLKYALWLYEAYSNSRQCEGDISFDHLMDPNYRFQGHGVHTYEHLRSLLTAFYASDNDALHQALISYLDKLQITLTPSGGPIGDECIHGRSADPTSIGYEYCSLQELLDSYTHLMQKTGDLSWADRIEGIFFNAAQGALHPQGHSIAYLKTDNSYFMVGKHHPDDPDDADHVQGRYKYSPSHQDMAVCCIPNAGRMFPYYVRAMWLRHHDSLIVVLYGPNELQTTVNGAHVCIKMDTRYPFEHQIKMIVTPTEPVEFTLVLRKPEWATEMDVSGIDADISEVPGAIKVRKTWGTGDRLQIEFSARLQVNQAFNGEYYLSYGPLVYALPVPADERVIKEHPVDGFYDYHYFPKTEALRELQIPMAQLGDFYLLRQDPSENVPWGSELSISGVLFNPANNQLEKFKLVPMGGTILRKVTFQKIEK